MTLHPSSPPLAPAGGSAVDHHSAVQYTLADQVATVVLNRPEVLNAMDAAMFAGLHASIARAQADGARALLITGAGRAFCAGANLANIPEDLSAVDFGEMLRTEFNPLILTLRALPMPVIVAVNGVAAGAGMSLAMAGDILIAGRSASFLQAFSKIGLIPDAGSTWFLPRLIGDMRARALAILATPLSVEDAQRWGLVWEVVDDAELRSRATALATDLASRPTTAFALTRQAFAASAQNDLATQLALEADLQTAAGRTADAVEGIAAFRAKRRPRFTGT
jgi:2-(1,2-epoxy-1,2-dihydrophenyl)acetyl-CoA isomerase